MPERSGDDAPLPAEARGVQGHLPAPSNATNVDTRHVPTPGVALAAGKVPGAPSLPEWDPNSFNVVLARMATELYRAPPNVDPQVPSPAKMDPALPTSGSVPNVNVMPEPPRTHQAVPSLMPQQATEETASLSPRERVGVRGPEVAPIVPSTAVPSSPFHSSPNFESLPGFSPILSFPLIEKAQPTSPAVPDQ